MTFADDQNRCETDKRIGSTKAETADPWACHSPRACKHEASILRC